MIRHIYWAASAPCLAYTACREPDVQLKKSHLCAASLAGALFPTAWRDRMPAPAAGYPPNSSPGLAAGLGLNVDLRCVQCLGKLLSCLLQLFAVSLGSAVVGL